LKFFDSIEFVSIYPSCFCWVVEALIPVCFYVRTFVSREMVLARRTNLNKTPTLRRSIAKTIQVFFCNPHHLTFFLSGFDGFYSFPPMLFFLFRRPRAPPCACFVMYTALPTCSLRFFVLWILTSCPYQSPAHRIALYPVFVSGNRIESPYPQLGNLISFVNCNSWCFFYKYVFFSS